MAYTSDKKPGELTALTTLATDDVFVVGDTSDVSEVAKKITKANILADFADETQTLTNKTIDGDNNTISNLAIGAEVTGASTDLTDTAAITYNADTDVSANGWVIDEDNMASNLATKVPTQQSVKAYVDSQGSGTVDVVSNVAPNRILGRVTAGSGDSEELTAAQVRTLINVEDGADVTDTTNVTAAGALMDSEVDADIKTLSLPANTTISAFGATLVDDADAATARTTLGVDAAGTDNSTDVTLAGTPDYITISGQVITRNQIDLTADVTGVLPEANLPDASTTAQGVIEVATAAETTTGTDATRAVSPDGLAGSDFGIRYVSILCFDYGTDTATGDGKGYFHIPAAMDGMNLISVHAEVFTAGTTGTTDIQIHNVDNALDMLSTKLTIDSAETGSDTAATAAVINTSNDHVNTNDVIRIDVDAVSTTAAKGLLVTMGFQLP